MKSGRLVTERRRAWGLVASAVCVALAFALETHNWNDVPDAFKTGLLAIGLAGLVALLLTKSR